MAQNAFVKAATLDPALTNVRTENGALSYATIGSALLDQFGKAGTARGRDIHDVWAEQSKLWADDPNTALRFPFYLRMITRQANVGNGAKTAKVQRGQGAKDESFKRFLWIAKYHPETFYANLWLIPIVGSWKDLWVLLSMDKSLDRRKFFEVMAEGINDATTVDLVKKYMPRIRSNSKCKTEWAKQSNEDAKAFAKFAGWSFEDYRTFKATGKAHTFQTYMCKGLYNEIDWNTIPGKALLNLVTGKFLDAHGLNDKYIAWLKTQPVAKFNGYAFELGHKLGGGDSWYGYKEPSMVTKITVDKQFRGLIETAKKDEGGIKGNVLCGLDTSGSMTSEIQGANGVTSYDVCVSLGIYFSELNEGAFHNVVGMFADTSELFTLSGEFSDKWSQIKHHRDAMGSTNFQSLIDLIVNTRRKHPEIPLNEFPQTLLVVSDMQFNPAGRSIYDYWGSRGTWDAQAEQTNYQMAMQKLRSVFPQEFVDGFKIIWWYCAGRPTNDYPTNTTNKGTYMISGFDGSVISFVLGGEDKIDPNTGAKVEKTMQEVVDEALSQEALQFLKLVD